MADLNVGVLLLTGTATGGGLWFVVRLVVKFQKDFTEAYARRIVAQDARIATMEGQIERLNQALIDCATERGALRAVVARAGIDWRPEDWGIRPGDR